MGIPSRASVGAEPKRMIRGKTQINRGPLVHEGLNADRRVPGVRGNYVEWALQPCLKRSIPNRRDGRLWLAYNVLDCLEGRADIG
jgi:hypothetical protein